MRTLFVAVVLALPLFFLLPAADIRGAPTDENSKWQRQVDRAEWDFSMEQTSPYWCALHRNGSFSEYEIRLTVQKGSWGVEVEVLDGEEVRASWKSHRYAVFHIFDGKLFYAAFNYSTMGGKIRAVDLSNGKLIWESRLKGLPMQGHSGYRNQMNLGATKDVVVIIGKESYGRYLEYKRTSDGKTVGHRIFE